MSGLIRVWGFGHEASVERKSGPKSRLGEDFSCAFASGGLLRIEDRLCDLSEKGILPVLRQTPPCGVVADSILRNQGDLVGFHVRTYLTNGDTRAYGNYKKNLPLT